MPAVLSHYLLGERVYNKLSAEIDGLDKNTFRITLSKLII